MERFMLKSKARSCSRRCCPHNDGHGKCKVLERQKRRAFGLKPINPFVVEVKS